MSWSGSCRCGGRLGCIVGHDGGGIAIILPIVQRSERDALVSLVRKHEGVLSSGESIKVGRVEERVCGREMGEMGGKRREKRDLGAGREERQVA